MNPLLVTSTTDSIGKTAITVALARIAADRGQSVGYMKPKGTRLQSVVGKTLDEDPMLARAVLGTDAEMHEMEPVVYSPTFIEEAIRGREDSEELRARIEEAYDGLAEGTDRMFIEGGGNVHTGGVVGLTDPEVAELLDADVVLVAEYTEPGDIDEVLAAIEDIGDRLAGVVFNRVDDATYDAVEADVVPYLSTRDVPVLGILPVAPELTGVTVAELASELGADTLVEGNQDVLVQRFAVGAMSAEAALRHFRRSRDTAVITGGDRSDIATAAIEANSVRCLVLTGGHQPSGSVLGKAEASNTPVLSVPGDTLTTIDRAEAIISGGRTQDAKTVAVVRDLLETHADLDALLATVGED